MTHLRRSETCRTSGIQKSYLYVQIADGVFPPPIQIGRRAVAWDADEVRAVNVARAAGATNDELKKLVKNLIALRERRWQEIQENYGLTAEE